MNKEDMIKVINRDFCSVGYPVPDNINGLTRQFAPKEEKLISFEELQKLSWIPGGMYLLKHSLVIKNEEVVKELLGDVEPEYYYSDVDIKNLLENGTLDQLLDCLEYGTDGVIEILKHTAVEIELPDMRKRNAILEKTGFNINSAIELKNAEEDEEDTTVESAAPKARRSAPISQSNETGRRAAAPKYKVVGE